jgi:hypothetical protein
MLYIASAADASRASLRQPEVTPIKILSANSFVHGKFAPFELARMAADWCDGRLLLKPTVELASRVFNNVSRATIVRERRKHAPGSLPLGLLIYGWNKSSEFERATFACEFEPAIWQALEHVVDHQH